MGVLFSVTALFINYVYLFVLEGTRRVCMCAYFRGKIGKLVNLCNVHRAALTQSRCLVYEPTSAAAYCEKT